MSYKFPPPRRPKRNRWGFIFFSLMAGVIVFKWFPNYVGPIPATLEKWRQEKFPSSAETPSTHRRQPGSVVPRVGSLPERHLPESQTPDTKPSIPRRPSLVPKIRSFPQNSDSVPEETPLATPSRESGVLGGDTELTPSNLPLSLPGTSQVYEVRDTRIRELEAKIAKYPVFALYRQLADRYLELGDSESAARVFRTQAKLYRQKGLEDAASIMEKRAIQYETKIRVFVADRGNETSFTGAPLEPRRGCYLGAFIDRDDALTTEFEGDNWQTHRLPSEFEARLKRRHASVFTYVKWGNFPREWLLMCKRQGVIPHIAWEPSSLSEVQDGPYLRRCGQFLRDLNYPVFVRFAGEMNGHWTPYHDNPALYREKFRLVHRVLHRYTNKVATIWCVNAIPSDNIAAYYPGDGGCDWVGVNLYSTPFADNDRTRQAFRESPLTLLDPIYRRYSARKPIAICEYAASHQSAVDGVVRTAFATEKMALLYGALPLLYPRVKMINWFSSNNLIHARAGRQLNNYRLTQQPLIQKTYRQLTASPHFLTSYDESTGASMIPSPHELKNSEHVHSGERIWLWVTGTEARPRVYVTADGQVVYAGREVGKHVIDLKKDWTDLSLMVYDEKGRCIIKRNIQLEN